MALWTQADIDTLAAAIKSNANAGGVIEVVYGGPPKREVKYSGLAEMRSLLAEMRREVASPPAYRRVKFGRGFGR